MATQPQRALPSSYAIGEELNWQAPWIDVELSVELPFWLMVDNTRVSVEVGGHHFEIAIHEEYFELYFGEVTESKTNVLYDGPPKRLEDLSDELQNFIKNHPGVPFIWRKCKTVLNIKSRCNMDLWIAAIGPEQQRPGVQYYLTELCWAHVPVINKLIQGYRLATYDYFPFETAPWDVPHWRVVRTGLAVRASLVPYQDWDIKPRVYGTPFKELVELASRGEKPPPPTLPYKLIEKAELQEKLSANGSPGELELLDALNLMERGDFSGAVRRVTTAIEVILEASLGKEFEASRGALDAQRFLKKTRTRFDLRLAEYELVTGRKLPNGLRRELNRTRDLRHRIVHAGYRIGLSGREEAQRSVDTGRWIFNWFENDKGRFDVREQRIAFRSLGRNLIHGIFPSRITPAGIIVSAYEALGKPYANDPQGTIRVMAAVIEYEDAFLVCQRRRGHALALRYEFPGGKARLSETPRQALARKLREELGATAEIGPELHHSVHRSSEFGQEFRIQFFSARLVQGGAKKPNFESIGWVPRAELARYNFLPADRQLVARLIRGSL